MLAFFIGNSPYLQRGDVMSLLGVYVVTVTFWPWDREDWHVGVHTGERY